jgi:hypothetical protein
MSQQNLNPSYWCFWGIKNRLKHNTIEKVMGPQNRKNKKLNKTTLNVTKANS